VNSLQTVSITQRRRNINKKLHFKAFQPSSGVSRESGNHSSGICYVRKCSVSIRLCTRRSRSKRCFHSVSPNTTHQSSRYDFASKFTVIVMAVALSISAPLSFEVSRTPILLPFRRQLTIMSSRRTRRQRLAALGQGTDHGRVRPHASHVN
jgi:hypothetical protein